MGNNNRLNIMGILSLLASLSLVIMYFLGILPLVIANNIYIIFTIIGIIILLILLLLLRVRFPKRLNRFFIIVFLLLSLGIGFDLYNSREDLSNDKDKLSKAGMEFVEIFYTMEIATDNKAQDKKNIANPSYLDYVIQKYNLWSKRNLYNYKKMKDDFSTDSEMWEKLLLYAQEYRIKEDWQDKLDEIEEKSKELYLENIKLENPKLYEWFSNISSGDFIEDLGSNKEEARRFYNTIFPNDPFLEKDWAETINKIKEEIKKDDKLWTRKIIRLHLRELFKEGYQKILL